MIKKTTHKTRESWIRAMADMLYKKVITMGVIKNLPLQIIKGNALEGSGMKRTPLSKIQFSCAYSPNMRVGQILRSNVVDAKVRAIGQCFYPRTVTDEDGKVIASFHTNIFITPKENNPVEVTSILLHELIHTVTQGHGHKGSFKTLCESVGLRLTPGGKGHTSALPTLEKQIRGLIKEVGKYPHKKWVPSNQYKKQTTRQFKMTSLSVMCDPSNYKNSWEAQAYSCRMSRQAMSAGFPMDPKGHSMYLELDAGQLEALVRHPVTHDDWHENTIKLPSGGRGLSYEQYKLTQGGPVDLIAPNRIADNILTRDENAVMFAVAVRANGQCFQWASALANDNISYFLFKEMVEDLGWDRQKVVAVVESLKAKDMIMKVDGMTIGQPKNLHYIHLNLDEEGRSAGEQSSAYRVLKSFDHLDPTGPNPFMVGSGASDPCPPDPKAKHGYDSHKRFCPEFVSRSSEYSPEHNREINARAIEGLEMETERAEDQMARQTRICTTNVKRQTLRLMTNLSDHIFMLEQRIEDLECEAKSIRESVI